MKKLILFLFLIIVMTISVTAIITTIYSDEVSTKQANLRISLYNRDEANIKNARVSAYIPYLDAYDRSRSFKLSTNKPKRVYLEMDIPSEAQGYYPVILTLQNDKGVRERTHTWIYIS